MTPMSPPPKKLSVTPISTELLEEIREFLHSVSDEQAAALAERLDNVFGAEPTVTRAWLLAVLTSLEAQAEPPAPEAQQPLDAWNDTTRPLARYVQRITGREPIVVGRVLTYWLRDSHGDVCEREYDLTRHHPREDVLLGLRAVQRIVRLDHNGEPLEG